MSLQSQTCKEILEQVVASGVDPDSDDWHDFFVKYAVKYIESAANVSDVCPPAIDNLANVLVSSYQSGFQTVFTCPGSHAEHFSTQPYRGSQL